MLASSFNNLDDSPDRFMVAVNRMKKSELIKQVAALRGVEPGAVADQVDQVVNEILRTLRRGQPAHLPGLGTIRPEKGNPGRRWVFRPESHER